MTKIFSINHASGFEKLILTCAYKDSDGKIENLLIENNNDFTNSFRSIDSLLYNCCECDLMEEDSTAYEIFWAQGWTAKASGERHKGSMRP